MPAGTSRDSLPSDLPQTAERLRRVLSGWVQTTRDRAGTPSSVRVETLRLLQRHGSLSIAALAEHRSVKHQSMRLVVAELEVDGAVQKTTDPADRRSQLVSLTAEGATLLREAQRTRTRWLTAVLKKRCTAQEIEELETAVATLERVLEKVSAGSA